MSFEVNTTLGVGTTSPARISDAYELDIISKQNIKDLFATTIHIDIQLTSHELIEVIKRTVENQFIRTLPVYTYLLIEFEGFLASIKIPADPFEKTKRSTGIGLYGSFPDVERVYKSLFSAYSKQKKNNVDWFYWAENRTQFSTIALEHKHSVRDEFFPWIKPGVEQFQKDFIASDASVLLMIGDPGTGKTTIVRDLINKQNLSTAVTYDEELMSKDSFFIEFINKPYDLLVIEDADVILRDRAGGNKIMSKLLNAGDGLIQTKKKIIFTANLTNLDEVDPALIRPGRCFEALVFRELTFIETQAAAKAAGLAEPDSPKTLSKLFSEGPSTKATSRMGFAFP